MGSVYTISKARYAPLGPRRTLPVPGPCSCHLHIDVDPSPHSLPSLSFFSLKPKRAQYNNTSHDYEIHLDRDSLVQLCPVDDDTASIPDALFNFLAIADLGSAETGTMADVIGVVERVDNWMSLTKKDGGETKKRALLLRDDSGGSIELTLWGQNVTDPGDRLFEMVQVFSFSIYSHVLPEDDQRRSASSRAPPPSPSLMCSSMVLVRFSR